MRVKGRPRAPAASSHLNFKSCCSDLTARRWDVLFWTHRHRSLQQSCLSSLGCSFCSEPSLLILGLRPSKAADVSAQQHDADTPQLCFTSQICRRGLQPHSSCRGVRFESQHVTAVVSHVLLFWIIQDYRLLRLLLHLNITSEPLMWSEDLIIVHLFIMFLSF